MIGRGLSECCPDPDNEYCLAFYAQVTRNLTDRHGLGAFSLTSMGGAIGIVAAATTLMGIIHIVFNDIASPVQAAIDRIKSYAGNPANSIPLPNSKPSFG